MVGFEGLNFGDSQSHKRFAGHFEVKRSVEGAVDFFDCHFPGVDDFNFELGVFGQFEGFDRRLVWAEVSEVVLIGNACGGNANVDGVNGTWAGFHNVAQELNAFGAGAVEGAAFAPPENVVWVEVGFAVTDVTATCKAAPKAFGEFLAGNVAPALVHVAFVTTFVVYGGFVVLVSPGGRLARVGALNAAVGDPGFVVVVKLSTVVNAAQVLHGVVGLYDFEEAVPVLFGFGSHQVIFVGEGPPDVSVGGQTRDGVFEVVVVGFGVHFFKTPAVVGVKENEVGFDVEVA